MNWANKIAYAGSGMLLALLLIGSPVLGAPLKVVVDNAQPHQTMEGFGATHLPLFYVGRGDVLPPNLRPEAVKAVYGQVGISMGSLDIGAYESPGGYDQRANDNNDPFRFDWNGFNWQVSDVLK